MGHCYLIYKNDDSGQFPMYRTTEGKTAVMIFKSHESASQFIDGKRMSNEWSVVQRDQEDAIQWLRDCMTNDGAAEIAIDPDPENCDEPDSTSVIPIIALLIEWEGEAG